MQVRLLSCCTTLLLLAFPVAAGSAKAALERPVGQGTVEVRVEGLRSGEGIVFVSLYLTDAGYPGAWQQAYSTQQLPASDSIDGAITVHFQAVPAGWLAVSVLHDADSNQQMATNILGIPTEGYGFSNNPKSFFGPPSFDKAAVYLEAGDTRQLVIKIK